MSVSIYDYTKLFCIWRISDHGFLKIKTLHEFTIIICAKKTGSLYNVKVMASNKNRSQVLEHMITFRWNDLIVTSLHGLGFLLLDRAEEASWLSAL